MRADMLTKLRVEPPRGDVVILLQAAVRGQWDSDADRLADLQLMPAAA